MKLVVPCGILLAVVAAIAIPVAGAAQGDALPGSQVRQRDQVMERTQARVHRREIIPGSELMTSKERDQYRGRMAAAATDADRERIRAEHVKAMQERARVRGLQLAEPAAAPPGGQK